MVAYVIRRLLLIIPTLFGIMVVNFAIINAAPGGPVEQVLARLKGSAVAATARFSGSDRGEVTAARVKPGAEQAATSAYRGARGLDPQFVKEIERQFGFDKPAHTRFFLMMGKLMRF